MIPLMCGSLMFNGVAIYRNTIVDVTTGLWRGIATLDVCICNYNLQFDLCS